MVSESGVGTAASGAGTSAVGASAVGASGASTASAENLAGRCHELLRRQHATAATAESLTGGLLGAAFTHQAGSSATYRGGVVSYAVDLKTSLLGVDADQLAEHGPVHPSTARAMAEGVRDRLGATYGLSTTGVAGPEPHGDQPVGTVDVACAGPGGTRGERLRLRGDREQIRRSTVTAALELLLDVLRATPRNS